MLWLSDLISELMQKKKKGSELENIDITFTKKCWPLEECGHYLTVTDYKAIFAFFFVAHKYDKTLKKNHINREQGAMMLYFKPLLE